jgi:hypothetical protein
LLEYDKSKMPRSSLEEAKFTRVYEDENKIVIPHTDIKKATSSNPYDFSKPYYSEANMFARDLHFRYGIEYPSIFQGLSPEMIFHDIDNLPNVAGMFKRRYSSICKNKE